MKYKIEIYLEPHITENKNKPYFWALFTRTTKEWCNSGSGWANTPLEAWNLAYEFYLLHL